MKERERIELYRISIMWRERQGKDIERERERISLLSIRNGRRGLAVYPC